MARTRPARAEQPRATRLMVAVLLLVAMVAGRAPPARVAPELLAFDAALVICHTGTGTDVVPKVPGDVPSSLADCNLCPACQIVAQPVLPVLSAAFVAIELPADTSHPAVTPPATGPPRPVSTATPPTGPPTSSV